MNQVKKNKEKQIHIIALFTPTNIINYTHWIYLFKFIKNEVMVSLNSINEGGESRTQAQQKSLFFFFPQSKPYMNKVGEKRTWKKKGYESWISSIKENLLLFSF